MVRQSMISLGYRVLTASNGEEASEICEEQVPALAILDVVMPWVGGVAAAAKLRAHYPDSPILFTSRVRSEGGCDILAVP